MIILIAAVGRNGVIGMDGELPWSIPADMARFKRLTMGWPVIMGRTTFESIGKPLLGRTNIVLSRDPNYRADGVEHAATPQDAIQIAMDRPGHDSDVYVIGGSSVYEHFMAQADRLELTVVDSAPRGDAWFPSWDPQEWTEVAAEAHDGSPPFEFKTLERAAWMN